MMKRWTLVLSLALAAAWVAAPASAQVGLDLHGLYAFSFNDDSKDGSYADDAFGGGAALVFCLGEIARLDLGADYYRPKHRKDSDVKYEMIPLSTTLRLGLPVEEILYIYLGGGGAYSFNDIDIKGLSSSEIELKNCFSYHICGGLEVMLTDNLAFRGEIRHVWMKPEFKFKGFCQKLNEKDESGIGVEDRHIGR